MPRGHGDIPAAATVPTPACIMGGEGFEYRELRTCS